MYFVLSQFNFLHQVNDKKVLGLCNFDWNLHDIYKRIQSNITLWENKGFNLQLGLHLDFLVIMTTYNSRYLYGVSGIGQVVIFAQNIPHCIWKCIFNKNMCNFVQLNTIMLQLGCPCRFHMQNICEWTKWLCGFSFIHWWVKFTNVHYNYLAINALLENCLATNELCQ